MAIKTTELLELIYSSDDDIYYLIHGIGSNRDKHITRKNLYRGINLINTEMEIESQNTYSMSLTLPCICALNTNDIVIVDLFGAGSGATMEIQRYSNESWSSVGSAFSLTNYDQVYGLCSLSNSEIALCGYNNISTQYTLGFFSFNGSVWSQVGNDTDISASSSGYVGMSVLNNTTIVLIDSTEEMLEVWEFNNPDWTQIGNGLNISGISFPSISTLNNTDIVFVDSTLNKVYVYRWDGSDFSQVGNDFTIPFSLSTGVHITTINNTDICLLDENTSYIISLKFDGEDWIQTGGFYDCSIIGINLAAEGLTTLNGRKITQLDTIGDLRVFRFPYHSFYPHNPINPDWT